MNFSYENNEQAKLPLYLQIKRQIQQNLIQAGWQFDTPIPSEHALAAEFNASIGTIRKAVDGLVEEGILVRQQGRGTFIRQPDFTSSMARFFRHRTKAGEQQIPVGVVKSVQEVAGVDEINRLLGEPENAPLVYLERLRLNGEKVILSEKIWLPKSKFAPLLNLPLEGFDNLLYPFYVQQCGQLVVSAKERLTFLADYQDEELTQGEAQAVIKISRLAKGLDGSIIEYRESYGIAQDFYYETIIS